MGTDRSAIARSLCCLAVCCLLAAAGREGSAQPRVEYQRCLKECDKLMRGVAAGEKSCTETIGFIHNDLQKVRDVFQGQDLCRWRRSAVCEDFQKTVLPALQQLLTLTYDVRDCLKVDGEALRPLLWALDPKTACKGDGIFTDLHDYLTARPISLARVNGLGTHYLFSKELVPVDGTLGSHSPACDEGIRPASHYVWPLFQFRQALESVADWQECRAGCREPTELDVRLWKLEETLNQVRVELETTAETGRLALAGRDSALTEEYGFTFPCTPFSAFQATVAELTETFERFDRTIAALREMHGAEGTRIDDLEVEAAELVAAVRALNVEETARDCAVEDREIAGLKQRRQQVLDTIQRSEAFSIAAADAFSRAGEVGEPCNWTGECNIPLHCREGVCAGDLALPRVRSLLGEARTLAERALHLRVFIKQGVNPAAAPAIAEMEERTAQIQAKLAALGWPEAVLAWRKGYRASLEQRLDRLSQEVERTAGEFTPEEGARAAAPACRTDLDSLRRAGQNVRMLRGALGNPDPVANPEWTSLKVADLARVEASLGELQGRLAEACRQDDDAMPPAWILAAAGGVVLLAAAAAALLLRLRSRRRSDP